MTRDRHNLPLAGLLNLLVIYVVWGSTYLAIRVAVREGSGWSPFWLGAARVLTAAAILLVFARVRGFRVRPTGRELAVAAASGLLMWVGGNGGVIWAEQRVDSGLAALIVGAMPIWIALMEAALDRRVPSLLLVFSLLSGFAGLGVLTAPLLRGGLTTDFLGVAVIVFGTLCWAAGSVLLHRRPVGLEPTALSGLQQLIGGLGFSFLALVAREPRPAPTAEGWFAWTYLLVFGSLIAFTAFIHALRLLPATVVMTYAYVNPVFAVILGWLILSEPITGFTAIGTLLILMGVSGVFRDKSRAIAED